MSHDDWNSNIRVNLKSCYRLMKEAWPALRNNKHGRVVFLSGFSEYMGAGSVLDGTTRLAIQGFTQALAKEGEKYDIKINTVLPVTQDRVSQLPNSLASRATYSNLTPLLVYLSSL
mmetsp:Transcript_26532/g.4646  ORF Transcript_26532/g.4646 Transcript_26532/m.4646 type:complete len:116 (+) Transcript_26532:321-668(+)